MEYEEKRKIVDKILDIFIGVDQHDWERCKAAMIEEPLVDYSSLNGNPGAKVKVAELIAGWAAFLPKFKATMHFTTNYVVKLNNDTATAFCYGHAIHLLPHKPGETWEVFGTYDYQLIKSPAGWKVTSMKFNLKHQIGKPEFPPEPAAK